MTAIGDTALEPTAIEIPPCDLYSEEPQLETYLHLQQMVLLLKCLEWWWKDRTDFFAAGNLSIYFSPRQIKSQDFRGPDFFVVLDTERKPRKSWVVWAEGGRYPNVIVEVLSDSTAASDRGEKKRIYQDIFRTPDYFWIDPDTLEFAGFHLVDGLYQAIAPNESGLLWSQQLGLYLGLYERQLRFFTPAVQLVPTPEEAAQQAVQQAEQEAIRAEQESRRAEQETLRAEQESRRAEQETLRAEQESRRAEQETLRAEQEAQRAEQEANRARALSDRLRQLGIDPDTV